MSDTAPRFSDAQLTWALVRTVSCHNFKPQNFKLSVSDPKSKYVAYVSVLSRSSNCQGLGRKTNMKFWKPTALVRTDHGGVVLDFSLSSHMVVLASIFRSCSGSPQVCRGGIFRRIAMLLYSQFSNVHVCFCGLDPGNLKFETVRINKQHVCFWDLRRSIWNFEIWNYENWPYLRTNTRMMYAQSAYEEFGFRGVWLKQTLNSQGWEFSCPLNFIGSLPESLTQGLLIGKLLTGGLGVSSNEHENDASRKGLEYMCIDIYIYIHIYIYIYIYMYIYIYI